MQNFCDGPYLRALYNAAESNKPRKESYLNDRLYWAFFYGLNNGMEDRASHSDDALIERRGTVPFLNGGLFDLEDEYDVQHVAKKGKGVDIPNAVFGKVLDLFEKYNFTVAESTPLDVEVAVDPEMLGKVFEELVTGRHESGSYYTPRPIVSFMCREALKYFLQGALRPAGSSSSPLPRLGGGEVAGSIRGAVEPAGEGEESVERQPPHPTGSMLGASNLSTSPPQSRGRGEERDPLEAAVAKFVDDGDPSGLTAPEAVLAALKRVKVCDPACGSGAYLLGMMQELLRLRESLFAAHVKDHKNIYDRKLEIIQNNLYGVDLDLFAVNIAKLRLWLSLAVDYIGAKPEPLPNLDFKIECGDSLTAPDPQDMSNMFRQAVIAQSDELTDLKGSFIRSFGAEKKKLLKEIKKREEQLGDQLPVHSPIGSVDWRIAFAEVFRNGGFDIALENPPYVRMELFKDSKPRLKQNFPLVYVSTADLYVYFFARTHQILRAGGSACFIAPNKWLKAGYGEPLRRFLATRSWVSSVIDFGHAKQIFQSADVFPSILVIRKPSEDTPPATTRVCSIPREQLQLEDLSRQFLSDGFVVPRSRLGADSWTLESPGANSLLDKITKTGERLEKYAKSILYRGILTGLNEAFLIDSEIKNRIVESDPNSEALLKPYLRGQDVSRWHADWAGLWMLTLKSSVNHTWPWSGGGKQAEAIFAKSYPSIYTHLNQFRDALIDRQDQGDYWWELRSCAYWDMFEKPKIIYPEITWRAEWCFDDAGLHINNTVYILPVTDLWILCVANSPLMWWYAWRNAVHGKDEALRFIREFVQNLPIRTPNDKQRTVGSESASRLIRLKKEQQTSRGSILNHLKSKFEVEKPSQKLQDPAALTEDAFVAEVQKLRGKRQILSAAQIKALQDEHVKHVRPLQLLAAEARQLEARVADLVNDAYGLSPDDVALMWKTAPPRMPGEPPTKIH